MIALEHVEAGNETRLGSAEDREIGVVLDLVVPLELGEEELQARREPGAVVGGRHRALAELVDRLVERGAERAKHVVALQPEARCDAEIGMAAPDLTRIAVEKQSEVWRPPGAAVEIEGWIGHGGHPVTGGRLATQ